MPHFQLFNAQDLYDLLSRREGETKLGEALCLPESTTIEASLQAFRGRFVLLGVPEDIGVRANGGIGGAHTSWMAFLKSFVNIQETAVLSGKEILLLGALEATPLPGSTAPVEALRTLTPEVDALICPVVQQIMATGKIPVVIGGGHNNAYPLLKALAASHGHAHAVNLDAHSDFRRLEGRHSGNGFRYAYEEGYLRKYAMLGLHEAYNSAAIVAILNENPDLLPVFFEDIFLRHKTDWNAAVAQSLRFVNGHAFGVELDVDCMEQALSSAATPVGITTQQALHYLYQCGRDKNAAYLHLPEGVSERADGLKDPFTGKLLSYLAQAFCKGVLERE